jgi:methylphosphotriester-DNA--protein-cysteine methyltransferase
MLRFVQSPGASYRPIRAQIQASLDTDDAELVTDICLLVTVIAHHRQQTWLTQMAGADARTEREALDQLKHVQQLWPEEIAAVRHVSDSLAGLCRQAGLPSARIQFP